MTKQVLKVIAMGILAGTAIFIMPFFIVKLIVFFLITGLIFRLLGKGGHWRRGYGIDRKKRYAFAKRWHSMSGEDRKSFMEKMEKELFNQAGPSSAENR